MEKAKLEETKLIRLCYIHRLRREGADWNVNIIQNPGFNLSKDIDLYFNEKHVRNPPV